MDKIATENLFLLEFLVDCVNLEPKCDCATGDGDRCVSFQFLDNSPLDICEEDFSPQKKSNDKDMTKNGKSCLFSLSPDQASEALKQFDIYVKIFKKLPEGYSPEKLEVGDALISISNLFSELINSVEVSDGTSPTAKTLKDMFDINSPRGETVGKIGVYIRMSCFGKLIVTQFQMNLDDKSVLFKDKDGKALYRYKKAGKNKCVKPEACTARLPSAGKGMGPGPGSGFSGPGFSYPGAPNMMSQPMGNVPGSCPLTPCMMNSSTMGQFGMPSGEPRPSLPNSPCPLTPCMMDPSMMGQFGMPNGAYQSSIPQSPCQECGANPGALCLQQQGAPPGMGMNMGYASMTPCIECGNIPNAQCVAPQSNMACCTAAGSVKTPCTECAGNPNAPCAPPAEPEGNYQEIGASMGGNSLTIRVHRDKTKVEQIDPNNSVISTNSSDTGCCCVSGQAGKKNKNREQKLSMRPGVDQGGQENPFAFRMGNAGKGGSSGNNVMVNPPVATAADGTKFTEFSDPNKELFILRVGKRSEGIDKKQNLELELCTPRGKVL